MPGSTLLDSGFGPGGIAFVPEVEDNLKDEYFRIAMEYVKHILQQDNDMWQLRVVLPMLTPNVEVNHDRMLRYGFQDISTHTYIIDLKSQDWDSVFQGFAKTMRYDIKQAEKKNINLHHISDTIPNLLMTDTLNPVDVYYDLHVETYTRTGVKPHPKAYFEKVYEYFVKTGRAIWIFASHEDKFISVDNFATFKKGVYYSTGASSEKGLELGAAKLIQARAVQWALENGYELFETGEGFPNAPKGDKLAGLTQFKKSFGGKLEKRFKALWSFR
jgi:lipid II:glycine glycyltransferase (peptidoglycan interpeptide bridge formation enzyme)